MLFILSGFFAVSLAILIHQWIAPKANYPAAVQGAMDTGDWLFAQDGVIPLGGEWLFYEGALLEPDDFKDGGALVQPTLRMVPGKFTDEKADHQGVTYGTYRLKVKVEENGYYSIRMKKVRLSSRVFINGEELGGRGQVGTSPDGFVPNNQPFFSTIDIQSGTADILIQVASFQNITGGLVQAPEFGRSEDMLARRDQGRLSDSALITAFLLFGLYYAGMFRHWRREPHLMYFSLFCLVLGLFFSIDNEILLLELFPGIPFLWLQKMLFFLPSLTIYFFGQYIFYYMGKTRHLLMRIMPGVVSVYLLVVLMLPNAYLVHILKLNMLIPILYFVALLEVIFRSRERGILGKGYLMLGVFSLVSMWVYAQFRYMLALDTPYYMIFSPLLLVLSQALLMTSQLQESYLSNERLNRQLLAFDRQKDEFLAKTSHELRSPLHGIINLSRLMLDDRVNPLHQAHTANVRLVHAVGRRLAGLVHDILDLNKIRYGQLSIHPKPVDLRMSVRFVIQTLSINKDNPDIQIINDVPHDLPLAWTDEDRLRQILHNLVENGIKYTERGSVCVMAEAREDKLAVSVTDTGKGIPPDRIDSLFSPFTSYGDAGEGWRSGLGLGLSIAKELVELQSGRLEVESMEGVGTTFTFTLPLANGAFHRDAREEVSVSEEIEEGFLLDDETSFPLPGSPHYRPADCRLLIVDDEPANRKILMDIADSLHYGYIAVASGKEALAALRQAPLPDLVLLDVMMPGITGLDVSREIRRMYSLAELPVLMLTASGRESDVMAAFEAGANDILQKPFELPELRARMQSLLAMKLSFENALRRELDFLQAQITPHFLYNSLNAMVGLSYSNPEKLRETIVHLSTYLRAKFTFVFKNELVPFESELELVKAYLAIEELRFGERLKVHYRTEEGFHCMLPPLILQPIVENAVRHGIGSKQTAGLVEITARMTSHGAEIVVTDDGAGMDARQLQALEEGMTGSVGVANVNRRLQMLYNRSLDIHSEPGRGTRVTLIIPEEEEDEL